MELEDDAEGVELSRAPATAVVQLPEFPALDLFTISFLPPSLTDEIAAPSPPPTVAPSPPPGIEKIRRRELAQLNKKIRRTAIAVSGGVGKSYKPRAKAVAAKIGPLKTVNAGIDAADLPTAGAGAFTGFPLHLKDEKVPWTEQQLQKEGFEEILWEHE